MGVAGVSGMEVRELWRNVLLCKVPESYETVDVSQSAHLRRGGGKWTQGVRLAVHAASEAIEGSGVLDSDRGGIGLSVGTAFGSSLDEEVVDALHGHVPEGYRDPSLLLKMQYSAMASAISIRFGIEGPSETLGNACCAGLDVVGRGLDWIRSGRCSAVIACACDRATSPWVGRMFENAGIGGAPPMSPWSEGRTGPALSDGAAAVVLEDMESAVRRRAAICGEVLGYGATSDAFHGVLPRGDGRVAAKAMAAAMTDAGVGPGDIGMYCGHGSATKKGDAAESAALKLAFGGMTPPPAFATKAVTGHCFAGASLMEFVLAVTALREATLPPTAGWLTPDRSLSFRPSTSPQPSSARLALCYNNALGGGNAAVVVGRC